MLQPNQNTVSLRAQTIIASAATKLDPNSLEGAAPTIVGDYQRITLTNHTIVGSTMDQALTYTTPLLGLDGRAVTISWEDLIRFIIKAGEAAPADVRIWCGLSEGAIASGNKGLAVGLGYSAGSWQIYRTANVAGASWAAATAAAAVDATCMAGMGSAQFSAATSQATQLTKALTSALAPINVTNTGTSGALAYSSPMLTHFFIGFDWITGAGGSDGETIDVKGIAVCEDLTSIPNVT